MDGYSGNTTTAVERFRNLYGWGATGYGADELDDHRAAGHYAYSDHLNASRVIVNAAGDVRWRWISEPFGTTAAETIPNSLENLVVNLRFPGQYFDKESGLSYNSGCTLG